MMMFITDIMEKSESVLFFISLHCIGIIQTSHDHHQHKSLFRSAKNVFTVSYSVNLTGSDLVGNLAIFFYYNRLYEKQTKSSPPIGLTAIVLNPLVWHLAIAIFILWLLC